MTSRRTFLRVLGAAVVGAVVVPSLPVSLPAWEYNPVGWPLASGVMPDVELGQVTAMIWEKVIGQHQTGNIFRLLESDARMCGLVYDVEMAA